MLQSLQDAQSRKSPFYSLQRFLADRPTLIETPLMRVILPEGLNHDIFKTICAIEVQGHIVDKLLLTYFALYCPEETIPTLDTSHKQNLLDKMITDLEQSPDRVIGLFSCKEHKHITSESRYDDFIPRVSAYVDKLMHKGKTTIRIIDVGCAPQTIQRGAPALEKLIGTLKGSFPSVQFDVIGTDASMSEDLLASTKIGAQGIRYVYDYIDQSAFAQEKFDVVIFNRVPLFNGITKNHAVRDIGFVKLRQMSAEGLFIFDAFASDTIVMLDKGKLVDAFLHADADLISRMVFRNIRLNVALSFILDYTKITDYSRLAKSIGVSPEYFLQNIQMYLQVFKEAYITANSVDLMEAWFRDRCIQPMPLFDLRTQDNTRDCLLKLRELWQKELQQSMEAAISKEQQNEYPWLELSWSYRAATRLKILEYTLANPRKAYHFFSRLSQFIEKHYDVKLIQFVM